MPVAVTYPGVYIEEIPSGDHTIAGAATSNTGFVGRAPQGPVNEAMTIFNFGDFQRMFGGLSYNYPMTYTVQDFFLNGGSEAIIVRLAAGGASKATLELMDGSPPVDGLKLEASSEGIWGNNLAASIDREGIGSMDDSHFTQNYGRYGLIKTDLFNLTVQYILPHLPTVTERFINVSITGDQAPNRLDRILARESNLARVPVVAGQPQFPSQLPAISAVTSPPGGPPRLDLHNLMDGSDGGYLTENDYKGSQALKTGIYALEKVDIFNLLCIPPDNRTSTGAADVVYAVYPDAAAFCTARRAMLIVDPPEEWANKFRMGQVTGIQPTDIGINGEQGRNAAVYFPRVIKEDPEMKGHLDTFPACGIIAGVMAATDLQSGVWTAPAGQDAALVGVHSLELKLSDAENGVLNPLGINCLRTFPIIGPVVWGARTLRGADQLADDYKYVPVRRLTDYIEDSLYRGTKWAVFEPNDENLWSSLRISVGGFMADLSRQGAFYGYKVTCDKSTTTESDIAKGIVNILVAFAPVKPAEFVVLQIHQQAGQ